MRVKILCGLIFLISHQPAIRPAFADVPSRPWSLQVYGFATRYHSALDYLPGAGVGLTVGRQIARNQLAVATGVEYTRATQILMLIGGSKEIHTDLYQSFVAARGAWQPRRRSRLTFLLELQTGLLLLRSQPWTFDAGIFGKRTFSSKSEAKLALSWSGGAAFRVIDRLAVLLFVKQKFSRFAQRQIGVTETTKVWRPLWHFAAGLSWQF
ncbi:MAG: hypothetical protein ACREOI_23430 [bacterium]